MPILAGLILALFSLYSQAATVNASSCSQADVLSAISSANVDDTVAVPAGSCSWPSLTVSKKITLQGAGIDVTTIAGLPFIGSTGSRVTEFTFNTGGGGTEIYGYGFRWDHTKVESTTWFDCLKIRDYANPITQMPAGLIDHNEFINCRVNMEGTPYIYSDDDGANQMRLWFLPVNYGTPGELETVYIEDNTFALNYTGNFNAIDANYGGSFVARYNTLYDGLFMETHSSQEGGNRSGKFFEVYGNIIDIRDDNSIAGGYSERWRGGTGFHFNNEYIENTATFFQNGIPIDIVGAEFSRSGCGLCNGVSQCDGNEDATGYPCRDQPGRGPDNPIWQMFPTIGAYTQPLVPMYLWTNRRMGSNYPAFTIGNGSETRILANRDWYDFNGSFNGTSGVGCGTLGNRPATCTTNVGYWASSQSCFDLTGRVGPDPTTPISGTFYKCTSTDTWTAHYTPAAYPHVLAEPAGPDTTPPIISTTDPDADETGVSVGKTVSVTFNEAMDPATFTGTTFTLEQGITPIAGSVGASGSVGTFNPTADLAESTLYTVTVIGGASGVTDVAGNPLAATTTWDFTTGTIQAGPFTGWLPSDTPGTIDSADTGTVELGTKFTTDSDGEVLGVRFYKSAANTGTHIGNLWTAAGANLASVTFTGETATGWQEMYFASPVAVTAGTTYVVSYFAPVGGYSVDTGYFASSGVDNGEVNLLQDGVDGGNGLYVYNPSTLFPTETFSSSSYWVDVVFDYAGGVDTTPPGPVLNLQIEQVNP